MKISKIHLNKIALSATLALALAFTLSCSSKTDVDFSIVPVKGSNWEYQYIDVSKKGKIIINPQFSVAHIFRDGLALVKTSGKDGKYGYIDKNGKFAIAPIYEVAQDFGDGVAWVQMEDQPPMLIDKKGKMLLQIDSLTKAYPFNDGIAAISVFANGQESSIFINEKGEPSVATVGSEMIRLVITDDIYAFGNTKTGKWGYRNKKGEIIVNEQFDLAEPFFDGMAVVMSSGKYGAINKKGEYLINPQYDLLVYDSDGLFYAIVGKKAGWVNKKGEIVINPQFDDLYPFLGAKLAPVKIGSKWAYVDRKGQIIINPQFDAALPFYGDYAMVCNNDDKIGFINQNGEFVVPPLYGVGITVNEASKYFFEYLYASIQNMLGFPAQYNDLYQNGNFSVYQKLKEKQKAYAEGKREKSNLDRKKIEQVLDEAEKNIKFTDTRDGKSYRVAWIGKQTWMAENLNYDASGSKCYGNSEINCQKYGRLYNWATAKKACPVGWHLPSNVEWDVLFRFADGTSGTENPYESETAGKYLKATSGWSSNGNGTDAHDFTALPGGLGNSDGSFSGGGEFGYWWSDSEYNSSSAYRRSILHYDERAYWRHGSKSNLLSVRCIQEEKAEAEARAMEELEREAKKWQGSNVLTPYKSIEGKYFTFKSVARLVTETGAGDLSWTATSKMKIGNCPAKSVWKMESWHEEGKGRGENEIPAECKFITPKIITNHRFNEFE
jgi:uncharacterized protein (TIGR02145 family)